MFKKIFKLCKSVKSEISIDCEFQNSSSDISDIEILHGIFDNII